MRARLDAFVQSDSGSVHLRWLALGAGLFAALLPAPGHHGQAQAQAVAVAASAPVSAGPIDDADRARLEQALQGMSAGELSLTYARIHASFRALLGHEDLGAARTLVDYATIAESEMHRRRIARPEGTESARQMLLLYELVL